MIKTTIKQIAIALSGGAIDALLSAKLPTKASYSVGKLARGCHAVMEEYNKDRQKVFEDGGCTVVIKGKNPDGSENKVYEHPEGEEKLKELQKKTEEMSEVEIEVNALPLDLAIFGDVELPGNAFYGLDWAIKTE